MANKKEFCIKTGISEAELANRVNDGWQIQFMQFMPDAKLHVVFFREVTVADAAPKVTVAPEPVVVVPVKEIASSKLPLHVKVLGLEDDLPKVAATKADDAPMKPCPDPVMVEALRRGRDTFERVRSEGEAAIHEASKVFRPNFSQGVRQ